MRAGAFRIVAASSAIASVALDPAYNALNSFALLNAAEALPELDPWVRRTAASLSPKTRRRHRLVFEGLGDALISEETWDTFGAYLDNLAAQDPAALRDRALGRLAADGLADRTALLADLPVFLSAVERLCPDETIDRDLFAEAHALLKKPADLRSLVAWHLRDLWDDALAAEWEKVQPGLQHQVRTFERHLASVSGVAETYRAFTGRDLPLTVQAGVGAARQVVFVPSPHVGPYVTWTCSGATARLFFGAPPNIASMRTSPVGRAELLVRLNALADKTRLHILSLLTAHGALYAQEIMTRLGLSQSSASRHLNSLRAAGLVMERRGDGANKKYSLSPNGLDVTFGALTRVLSGDDAPLPEPGVSGYPRGLRRFLDNGGHVSAWPAREKDRLVVLDYLASRFDPGRAYSEKEVNTLLIQNLHSSVGDYVILRRALYDYGFLDRERDGSRYWRAERRAAAIDGHD